MKKPKIGDLIHVPTLNKSGYIKDKIGRLYLVNLFDSCKLFKADQIQVID